MDASTSDAGPGKAKKLLQKLKPKVTFSKRRSKVVAPSADPGERLAEVSGIPDDVVKSTDDGLVSIASAIGLWDDNYRGRETLAQKFKRLYEDSLREGLRPKFDEEKRNEFIRLTIRRAQLQQGFSSGRIPFRGNPLQNETITLTRTLTEMLKSFINELAHTLEGRTDAVMGLLQKTSLAKANAQRANHSLSVDAAGARTGSLGLSNRQEQVIDRIIEWANDESSPPLFWLGGPAGAGKTTIAYNICERLSPKDYSRDEAVLGASFFCNQQIEETSRGRYIVPSISFQLAQHSRSFARALFNVDFPYLSIRSNQLRLLLLEPWDASIRDRVRVHAPYLIVVDALDEHAEGAAFLRELIDQLEDERTQRELTDSSDDEQTVQWPGDPPRRRTLHLRGLKFLVTSRPTPRVASLCSSLPQEARYRLDQTDEQGADNDILAFLRAELPDLKDDPQLAYLAHNSFGAFACPTTVVRHLRPPDKKLSVEEQVALLQELVEASPTVNPSKRGWMLDNIYIQILTDALLTLLQETRQQRLVVLYSLLCLEANLTIQEAAMLLGLPEDTIRATVESLRAVLYVSPMDQCIYWYHSSFLEFVVHPSKSNFMIKSSVMRRRSSTGAPRELNVFCDQGLHHGRIARACLRLIMDTMHFNVCELPSSYVMDEEIDDISSIVNEKIRGATRYAARRWAQHYIQSRLSRSDMGTLETLLQGMLMSSLLIWMEHMNLIGEREQCAGILTTVQEWYLLGSRVFQSKLLQDHLAEAIRFAKEFATSPAARSTPHLYISALAAWPPSPDPNSLISGHWKMLCPRIPILDYTRLKTRDTGNQTGGSTGHSDYVTDVAFCGDSNDRWIVSSSEDDTVCIWNAETGECLRRIERGLVKGIGVSPGGKELALGCRNHSITIIDAEDGRALREIKNNRSIYHVRSIVYSPNGAYIASVGSGESKFFIWDATTGEMLLELQSDQPRAVRTVCFSPDSSAVACGAGDGVQVWDPATGEQLAILVGHHDANLPPSQRDNGPICVAYSPDGTRIVSGAADRSMWIWDVEAETKIGELVGHKNMVLCVTYSPDGKLIASGSKDETVRIWDAETFQQAHKLFGHTRSVNSIAFSPGGEWIVSCSDDFTVRVWTIGSTEAALWHVQNDWIVDNSPEKNKIMWLSPDIRRNMYTPHTKLIISDENCARLDLSQACIGQDWMRCYDALVSQASEDSKHGGVETAKEEELSRFA